MAAQRQTSARTPRLGKESAKELSLYPYDIVYTGFAGELFVAAEFWVLEEIRGNHREPFGLVKDI